ncbi:hypothetical protein LCGC14_0667740 [marine sediment metagenome]|uniref:Uncharacterized protein n=1 Tax=marine sediment metagenome TaxID=412755 RepID=A0A0F9QRT3_9ZZZZ
MPDFNNFVYFVLVRNGNASYSFTGYSDIETGEVKVINFGKKDPKTGNDLPHRFRFDRAHRSMRWNKNHKDIHGNSVVDFLRNFPECGGSPGGVYTEVDGEPFQSNMMFKEMNESKDAEIALDAKRLKNKAETTALKLKGEELSDMAVLCGMLSKDEGMQLHRVVEYAGASPEKWLEMYDQPERTVKALLQKAVAAGVVDNSRGTLYVWENITIGANESLAISKLMEDSSIREAIEQNLTVLGA